MNAWGCDIMYEFVDIDKVESVPRETLHRLVASIIANENLIFENNHCKSVIPMESFYSKYGKRILDIMIALVAIIITIPINIFILIVTLLTLGFPIFYCDKRVGKDGKIFHIVKFRNMTNEKDQNGDLLPPDKRVTKWGKFVRKTSLDELLNFWSILKGDMSIIGPRPLQPAYMERYSNRHKMRNCVRPGLECPIINYIDHLPTWYEQFENDIYYVEHISFLLDIRQSISLLCMVFNKKIRKRSAYGIRGGFMGYTKDGKSINAKATPIEYVNKAIFEYREGKR